MGRLTRPPPGTHWRFDPDHRFKGRFPEMQLIDTRTGEVLGNFSTAAESNNGSNHVKESER